MSIADKLTTIAENVPKVYEAGKQAEYDAFWDNYQRPNNVNYPDMYFAGVAWTKETFKPKSDIKLKNGYSCFLYNKIGGDLTALLEELGVKLDTSEAVNMQSAFTSSTFTRIPVIDLRKTYILGHTSTTFSSSDLVTIDGLIVNETTLYNNTMFQNATKLANITFEGVIGNTINFQWCPLTKASITNIFDHLSSTATGQTATFNKAAKEAAFTADEWAALIADKTNWTLSLV